MLNTYFDEMVKEIIAQDGILISLSEMPSWPFFRGEYHLDRAIDAALAVRKKSTHLSELENERTINRKFRSVLKAGK